MPTARLIQSSASAHLFLTLAIEGYGAASGSNTPLRNTLKGWGTS